MRRAVITASATAAGVVLLLSLKPHDPSTAPAISSAGAGSARNTTQDTGQGSGAGAADGGAAGSGATQTVTGSAVNTRYGPVQVKVTMAGGRISKIDVVQYPTRDRRDQEINSSAIPQLNQEALAAQSADIDVVSGATYTSDGYTRSLQSALDQVQK
ncbi:FMN-binding protein [Kitasatospora sp. YST-16]|uniref:FMN-binding protein n=1 Tax=unclassified Kitasatospora TaxID=2633591 RepID=UPI0004C3E8D9|nr:MULTISPECIES: FMN-binding protein [unclassified Kitasatospora]WAL74240.1 FMN-binding protein [Kitasatospora sp. YST-16]WNW40308.1 FMN-binding protein [Streptomyces sp. Li-HN-5-13]